jgi:glycosyltransferase involved in cell wall biosynthesis
MRILFICPYLPYPIVSGGHTRVYNLLKLLSRKHQVHLVAYQRGPVSGEQMAMLHMITAEVTLVTRVPLWHPGNLLRYLFSRDPLMHVFNGRSQAMTDAIERVITEWKPDIAHVEHFHTAHCLLRAPSSGRLPRVIGEQGVEYVILDRLAAVSHNPIKRMLSRVEQNRIKRFELAVCSQFDRCIEVSDEDRDIIQHDGLRTPVDVVPNGVDTQYFKFNSLPHTPDAIMFLGTFKFFGNRDAIRWLIELVWPVLQGFRPGLTFYVVGNQPPRWLRQASDQRLIVTGWVEDVRAYLIRSMVVVSPIRIGSGTKLKIMEAMAIGRPVVTTTMGLEGIPAVDGRDLLVRDEPGPFAEAILQLLDHPSMAATMGRTARELIERMYSWDAAVKSLEQCYRVAVAVRRDGVEG